MSRGVDLSEIEKYVIKKVKEYRKDRKVTQEKLSIDMGFSESFIGNVENPNQPEKYNVIHLNDAAKILKCSPKDFWPEDPL